MQFTPQQLAGAGRYNSTTRIGNWNEDVVLNEYRMKEYRLRKQRGQLAAMSQQTKFDISNQRVPLSYTENGQIRFGDYVVIQHEQTGGSLACDVWEETLQGSGEYILSVARTFDATARNTFKIVPLSNQEDMGSVIKYGEPFRVMCNESMRIDEGNNVLKSMLYLKSCIKSDRNCSNITQNQLVSLSNECNANTVWIFSRGDVAGAEQYLAEGSAVQTDHKVSIIHKMTRQALFAESKNIMTTDFGNEYEVCCLSTRLPGKCHNLTGEASGSRTGNTLGKSALPQNSWIIRTAESETDSIDTRHLPEAPTPRVLLNLVRSKLNAGGPATYRHLAKSFKKMDQINGQVDREDFKWGLKDFGLSGLQEDHYDALLDEFDTHGNGLIRVSEFVSTLRGELAERRKRIINMAYDKLDHNCEGKVTLEDLANAYDTTVDSRVGSEQCTNEECLAEFISLWDTQQRDGIITRKEFEDYYADLSAAIEDDDTFERVLRSAWGLE